jgi:hypothetical protein
METLTPAESFLVDLWADVEAGKRGASDPHSFIFGARTLLAYRGECFGSDYELLTDALQFVLARQYGEDSSDPFFRGMM